MSVYEFEADLTITVKVVVDTYINTPPDPRADSDVDYRGEYCVEWHLEDGNGNRLDQVEGLLTKEEILEIEEDIETERIMMEIINGSDDDR